MRTQICEMLGDRVPDPCVQPLPRRDRRVAQGRRVRRPRCRRVHCQSSSRSSSSWIENEIGDAPYGVDLLIPQTYVGSQAGGFERTEARRHAPGASIVRFVDSLLDKYDVPELPDVGPGRPRRGRDAWSVGGVDSLVEFSLSHTIRSHRQRARPPARQARRSDAHERGILVGRTRRHDAARGAPQGHRRRPHRRPGHRGRRTHRRDRDDGARPRGRRRRRADPVLAAGGIASDARSPPAMALGAAGRLVRFGVADHRGGRDAAGREGEVPGRVARATPSASRSTHRQAGAHAAHGVDGRVGATRTNPDPLPMPLQTDAHRRARRRASAARRASTGTGAESARDVLRRAGRRQHEPGEVEPPGRARDGRRVRRGGERLLGVARSARPPESEPSTSRKARIESTRVSIANGWGSRSSLAALLAFFGFLTPGSERRRSPEARSARPHRPLPAGDRPLRPRRRDASTITAFRRPPGSRVPPSSTSIDAVGVLGPRSGLLETIARVAGCRRTSTTTAASGSTITPQRRTRASPPCARDDRPLRVTEVQRQQASRSP